MPSPASAQPPIATRSAWLAQRVALLEREKEATRLLDRLAAERRRLPMVRIEENYVFEDAHGKCRFSDLFEGRTQLIVYHFMFDPEWNEGCPGCTGLIDEMGDLSLLAQRDTTFVLVARAPIAKLEAYRQKRGWNRPWYSSFGNAFNYDFHVTQDETVRPVDYNYRSKAEMIARGRPDEFKGEVPGLSVFFRTAEGTIYHTYSAFARGVESLTDSYALLDVTPFGRQEDWEDSPAGWPQRPTYGG